MQNLVVATSSEIYIPPLSSGFANILWLFGPGSDEILFDNGEYRAITNFGPPLEWENGPPVSGNWVIATAAAVPEPSTLTMFAISAASLAGYARRRSYAGSVSSNSLIP